MKNGQEEYYLGKSRSLAVLLNIASNPDRGQNRLALYTRASQRELCSLLFQESQLSCRAIDVGHRH